MRAKSPSGMDPIIRELLNKKESLERRLVEDKKRVFETEFAIREVNRELEQRLNVEIMPNNYEQYVKETNQKIHELEIQNRQLNSKVDIIQESLTKKRRRGSAIYKIFKTMLQSKKFDTETELINESDVSDKQFYNLKNGNKLVNFFREKGWRLHFDKSDKACKVWIEPV